MEPFDEKTFIWTLIDRVEEVKKFATFFQSEWLNDAVLQPVYDEIVEFAKKKGISPSIKTLRDIVSRKKGEEVYESRYKKTLDEIEALSPDKSFIVYTLDLAVESAICRSFDDFTRSQRYLQMVQNNEGALLRQEIRKWDLPFLGKHEDLHLPAEEAFNHLYNSVEFIPKDMKIRCGIDVVDKWCGGGLRTEDLGIFMAPTGHGKTAAMIFITHHMAVNENKKVWLITNEMSMDRITERFISRLTGVKLDSIRDDPTTALSSDAMKFIKQKELHKNIMFSYINRDASTEEIEAEVSRTSSVWNWNPDVLIIDYMERMKPNSPGIRKDKSWIYYGEIAKDLVRLAKSRKCLIWTAIQTNRLGLGAKELMGNMAQGSIMHLQEASALIALHQPTDKMEGKEIIEFKPLKIREAKWKEELVKLIADLDTMTITNKVWETPEEVDRSSDENVPRAGTEKRKYQSKFSRQNSNT